MNIKHMVPWKWGRLQEDRGRPSDVLRREMDQFSRYMSRLFDDFGPAGGFSTPDFWNAGELMPSIAESEDDKAVYVSVELPGMDEKDVQLSLSEGMLTIRGEKKADEEEKGKDFHRIEHSYGAFRRVVPIPAEIDESKIEAKFAKGVLKITLPKTREAQAKVRNIEVKTA